MIYKSTYHTTMVTMTPLLLSKGEMMLFFTKTLRLDNTLISENSLSPLTY